MSFLHLIFLGGGFLYVLFGAYVYRLNPRSPANRIFLFVCACYAVWAFAYSRMHAPGARDNIWFWYRLSIPFASLFSILLAQFFLNFTGMSRRFRTHVYLLYLPGIAFLAYGWFYGGLGAAGLIMRGGIWVEAYNFGDRVNLFHHIWLSYMLLLNLGLIIEWKRKAETPRARKQARIILFYGAPAAAATVLTYSALIFLKNDFINLGPIVGALWMAGVWYAVSKHGFLTITPEIAFEAILKCMSDGLVLTDEDGVIRWMNRAAAGITGYRLNELEGGGIEKIFKDKSVPSAILSAGRDLRREDIVFISKSGAEINVSLGAASVFRGRRPAGRVFSFQDITGRKKAEDEMRYMSFHDKLTGLYNRSFAEEEIRRLDTPRQLPLSVVVCDVNGLKTVNDLYGHAEGDKLIAKAAGVIGGACRKEDIISRWGGDEFLLLLPRTSGADAKRIAMRISANPSGKNSSGPALSIACGVASKDNTEQEMDSVIRKADDRMYAEKMAGSSPNGGPGSAPGGIKKILIVEDEAEFAEALSARLESAGYEVHAAAGPEEGIAAARRLLPGLIIMDIAFPGEMNGYTATEIIKRDKSLKAIPVIMLSALSGGEEGQKGLSSGAECYMIKPLDSRSLLGTIRDLEKGACRGKAQAAPPSRGSGAREGGVRRTR